MHGPDRECPDMDRRGQPPERLKVEVQVSHLGHRYSRKMVKAKSCSRTPFWELRNMRSLSLKYVICREIYFLDIKLDFLSVIFMYLSTHIADSGP